MYLFEELFYLIQKYVWIFKSTFDETVVKGVWKI